MSLAPDKQVPMGVAAEPQKNVEPVRIQWTYLDGRRVRVWSMLRQPTMQEPEDTTARRPLVLLHGLGCAVEFWLPTLQHLARCGFDRPVYSFDMPGSGHSEGPREALSIPELADWTVRLMDHLGVSSAHLVGNSLGCQVALAIARQHPNRAVSLVLGGVTPGGDLVPLWRMGLGLLLDGLSEPGVYDGSVPRMYFQTGPRRYFATVFKMRDDHPVRDAAQVVAPCLVIRGTRDRVVPEWAARTVADVLPLGHYHAVEGSPHAVQYAAPETYTPLLTRFCEQVEPTGDATVLNPLDASETKRLPVYTKARPMPGMLPVGDTSIYYETATPGPLSTAAERPTDLEPLPVLLLHGLAGSGEVWNRFFPLLNSVADGASPARTVYLPDLPGSGQSSAGAGTLNIDALGDWCARFLDKMGIERADIAAHSMGCQVALAFADRHAERVGKVVLVGPTTGKGAVPLWRYLIGSIAGGAREPIYYRMLALRMFWRMGGQRYLKTLREMMHDDAIGRARRIAAPCLVVRGSRDTIIPDAAARLLSAAIPNGAYQVVEGAAHMVPFTYPEELAELSRAFWDRSLNLRKDHAPNREGQVQTPDIWGKALAAGTR